MLKNIINEQAFVEKWVMVNNKQEYKSSFKNYIIKGPWTIFKSIFIGEDDFIKKENNIKDNKIDEENKKEKKK